jgi:phosphohistidine swiveling domain-containing protein
MKAIDRLLEETGLGVSSDILVDFIRRSIQAREYAKFEFTKNLSDALQFMGLYAEQIGISKEELSYIPVQKFLSLALNSPSGILSQEFKRTAGRNRKRFEVCKAVLLPSIITSADDIYDFHISRNRPNFITSKKICAEVVNLTNYDSKADMEGKIVLVENADPGYDWIFGRNIAGIITRYGGVASHMSIRAAEFGLPAAIGCGEMIFRNLLHAKKISLDCSAGQIHVIES